MDENELKEFLESNGFKPHLVERLLAQGLDYNCFQSFTEEQFEKLGAKKAQAIRLKTVRDEHLKKLLGDKPTPKGKWQSLRIFGKPPKEGMYYEKGNFIPHESGGSFSYFDRAREFKSITGEDEKFIGWLKKFVIGCLNRRCNGTIFFGVEDGNHGMISGIEKPDVHKLQDLIDKSFLGRNPSLFTGTKNQEMKNAIKNSLSNLYSIPVRTNDGRDLVVIELDVLSCGSNCGDITFYAKQKSASHAEVFVRDGASTHRYEVSKMKPENESYEKVTREIQRYISELDRKEKENDLKSPDVETKLRQLICKGRPQIPDTEFHYMLLCNGNSADADFGWVSNLKWHCVIDMDASTKFLNDIRHNEKIVKKPREYTINVMEEMLQNEEDPCRSMVVDDYPVWLLCAAQNKSLSEWNQSDKGTLNKILALLTHVDVVEDTKKVVFVVILDSTENLDKMAYIMKDLNSSGFKQEQFVCLYQNQCVLRKFEEKIGDIFQGAEWDRQKVEIGWQHLSSFCNERLESFKSNQHFSLPSSSGTKIPLSKEALGYYKSKDVNILGVNHGEDLDSNHETSDLIQLANETIVGFMKGQEPSWDLFYFSDSEACSLPSEKICPGVIKRQHTEDLKKDLQEAMKPDREEAVVLRHAFHEPGAGASTIAMHTLWQLRKEMRSLALRGSRFQMGDQFDVGGIDQVVKIIFEIHSTGEKTEDLSRALPVLILLDDSSTSLGSYMKKKLEENVESKKIMFTGPMFLILNVCLDAESNEDEDTICVIKQKLTDKDKELFKSRLKYLRDEAHWPVEDMLSFVIIAEDFDEKSEYVKEVVVNATRDIEVHPMQRKLLIYLSILKWYVDLGLPVNRCEALAFDGLQKYIPARPKPLSERLCHQAKLFVNQTGSQQSGSRPFQVLQVSHKPVAWQIIRLMAGDQNTKVQLVKDMLQEKVFIGPREFLSKEVSMIFRKLLILRPTIEIPDEQFNLQLKKKLFSELISELQDENGQALELLKTGFQNLTREEDKALVAQGIARFLNNQQRFEEAKEWANQALEICPSNFTMFDTLGQVLKRELTKFIESVKKPFEIPACIKAFNLGQEASNAFSMAEKLYKQQRNSKKNLLRIDYNNFKFTENIPGLFGLIATNLSILELLMNSSYFKESSVRQKLIDQLLKPKSKCPQEILNGFPPEQWEELGPYICGLFSATEISFQSASMTFWYSSEEDTQTKQRYTVLLKKSQKIFKEISERRGSAELQLTNDPKVTRLYFSLNFLTSFGSLIMRDDTRLIEEHGRVVQNFEESMTREKFSLRDKLVYANVFFALEYHCCENPLKRETTRTVVTDIMNSAEFDNRYEPELFNVLLIWSRLSSARVETERSVKKLQQLANEFPPLQKTSDWYGRKPSRVIFFLGENDLLISSKKTGNFYQRQRFNGRLDRDRKVVKLKIGSNAMALHCGRMPCLKIPTNGEVSVTIGFTVGGPLACDIRDNTSKVELQRVAASIE